HPGKSFMFGVEILRGSMIRYILTQMTNPGDLLPTYVNHISSTRTLSIMYLKCIKSNTNLNNVSKDLPPSHFLKALWKEFYVRRRPQRFETCPLHTHTKD
ncbi:14311_t:CDS:1, partial [Funneliformis mosseae]